MKLKKILSVLTATALSLTMCMSTSIFASAEIITGLTAFSPFGDFDRTGVRLENQSDWDTFYTAYTTTDQYDDVEYINVPPSASITLTKDYDFTQKGKNISLILGQTIIESGASLKAGGISANSTLANNGVITLTENKKKDNLAMVIYSEVVNNGTINLTAGNEICIADFDRCSFTNNGVIVSKKGTVFYSGKQPEVTGTVCNEIKTTPVSAHTSIPEPTYTVVIPAKVDMESMEQVLPKYKDSTELAPDGKAVVKKVQFKVYAINVNNLFDDMGYKPQLDLSVSYDGTMTEKTDTTKTLPYKLSLGETAIETNTDTLVTSFINTYKLAEGKENSVTLTASVNRTDITAAGEYQGTMTFTVSRPVSE